MNNIYHDLILSYDRAAGKRDQVPTAEWKEDLRKDYLHILTKEHKSSLVDIGAGTGVHAKFFHDGGMKVFCIDFSPELVRKCIEKGLSAQVMNMLDLATLDEKFDSAFALNSLLHIPLKDLQKTLENIASILHPEGLFLWGQYGGEHREGVFQDDNYQPKRFFSLLDDEQIHDLAIQSFEIVSFNRFEIESISPLYFQRLLLRVKV